MCSIYAIYSDKHVYVGQTCNIKQRLKQHKVDLKRGKHHCKHLQNFCNSNKTELKFKVLEECSAEETNNKETHYWDLFKKLDYVMFNQRPSFGVLRGSSHGMFGFTHNTEARQSISKANIGSNNGMAKYRYFLLFDNKLLYTETLNPFCKERNLTSGNLTNCFNNKPYHHAHKGYKPVLRLSRDRADIYPAYFELNRELLAQLNGYAL